MNAREERGLVIAATKKLVQKGKVWIVLTPVLHQLITISAMPRVD